jgi:chorismate synthase
VGKETSRDESVAWDYIPGESHGSMGLFTSIHGIPLLLSVCLKDVEAEVRARRAPSAMTSRMRRSAGIPSNLSHYLITVPPNSR